MSFFGSLLGDFEDDPFTGHMRQMNRMMNSFFTGSPFGGMMGGSTDLMPFDGRRGAAGAMMPFGFPDMDRMFQGIDQGHAAPRGNCHSFTTSTVMTMSNGPDGRPQVYQASQSVRAGPGGVRETKKTVADSRSGVKKMAIGHHIGDRSHILEREQNVHSGEHEEREEFINLDEEEAPDFNREWQNKTRTFSTSNAIGYPSASAVRYSSGGRRNHDNTPMLPPAPSQSTYRSRPRTSTNRRSNYSNSNYPALPPPSSNDNIYHGHVEEAEDDDNDDEADDDDDEEGGVSIVELEDDEDCEPVVDENKQESTHQKKDKANESSRKREHEPDVQYKSKIQKLDRDTNVSK